MLFYGIIDAMGYHKIKRILGQKCLDSKKALFDSFGG
jgi:hypothetical protein